VCPRGVEVAGTSAAAAPGAAARVQDARLPFRGHSCEWSPRQWRRNACRLRGHLGVRPPGWLICAARFLGKKVGGKAVRATVARTALPPGFAPRKRAAQKDRVTAPRPAFRRGCRRRARAVEAPRGPGGHLSGRRTRPRAWSKERADAASAGQCGVGSERPYLHPSRLRLAGARLEFFTSVSECGACARCRVLRGR